METINRDYLLKMYLDNSRDVYLMIEVLAEQVAKRMKKQKAVSVEYLAACSSMEKIISRACKIIRENDGYKVTTAERKKQKQETARYIIEDFAPAFL